MSVHQRIYILIQYEVDVFCFELFVAPLKRLLHVGFVAAALGKKWVLRSWFCGHRGLGVSINGGYSDDGRSGWRSVGDLEECGGGGDGRYSGGGANFGRGKGADSKEVTGVIAVAYLQS